MGKIPVQELARLMGVANQDLVFKLKSIGVRVEGEEAHIDSEIVAAILQGKKLPQPREVILRDESATAESARRNAAPAAGRRAPAPNPLRPARPRAVIQRVEPRIKTLPASDRSAPFGAPGAGADEAPEAPLSPPPTAPTSPPRPAFAAGTPSPGAAPTRSVVLSPPAARRPLGAGTPGPARPGFLRPGGARPGSGLSRPGGSAARPAAKTPAEREREEREKERERRAKKGIKKPAGAAAEGEDLRAYMGSVQEIEKAQAELIQDPSASARRRRRTERKESEDGGKVLTFHKQAPAGPITISEGMTLREFSEKLGVRARDLIKLLFDRGIVATINHVLDAEMAQQLAGEFGAEALVVTFEQEEQMRREADPRSAVEGRVTRAPVVTIMGHVDHGKTSLLDAIRSSNVTASESGGITQHIGAYHVDVGSRKIVFLDTPGHEAFTLMRARGARVTDLVVLVVAADDGVMPQTVEAIDHARAAGVPIVIALNKIDKPNANPDRVKKDLADHDLMVEEWGGQTVAVPVSAIKKQGVPELLEMILLTADLLDLKGDPEAAAQGTIIEARKEVGRGVVSTVLVQNGSLRVGDIFVAGATWGRVRAMADENRVRIETAGPSTPVEVSGFSEVPAAGDNFQVVEEEAKARAIVDFRRQEQRRRELAPTQAALSLEQIFSQIERGEVKELPVVLKADVQGSVEVLRDTLVKLSTEKVRVNVIHSAVGAISTNDVLLAAASKALIVGFSVRPEKNAAELAEKEGVELRLHTVIYELADELRKAMLGLLEPVYKEVTRGRAEVREVFKVPKVGVIAGCHVVEGVVPRAASARLVRDGRVVYEGKIASLRRFKDDASEVRAGFDCGIGLDRFQDAKPGDVIEAFAREEVAPVL